MFHIGKTSVSKETYQYSYVFSCNQQPGPMGGYHVTLGYDVGSIGVSYLREEWTLLQVFTSLSAVIAGVYVIMRIIKSSLDKFT